MSFSLAALNEEFFTCPLSSPNNDNVTLKIQSQCGFSKPVSTCQDAWVPQRATVGPVALIRLRLQSLCPACLWALAQLTILLKIRSSHLRNWVSKIPSSEDVLRIE
jgi:hypothetical protein